LQIASGYCNVKSLESRSYRQFCGIAHALDLVGERWSILVVRELLVGPRRFTDLVHGLPGIGTNILSARLKQLEHGGIVQRRRLPPPAASAVYELTEYGRELEPILHAVGRWGAKTMGTRQPTQSLRSSWLAVALQAFSHPEASVGVRETYELRLGDGVFHVRVDDGSVRVLDGPVEAPTLVIEIEDEKLIAFLSGALDAGAVQLSGDEERLLRFREIFRFPVPEPIG
jgi:DNA-binding HxlR family transcriptional regulator